MPTRNSRLLSISGLAHPLKLIRSVLHRISICDPIGMMPMPNAGTADQNFPGAEIKYAARLYSGRGVATGLKKSARCAIGR
jgi:hypothetical protein